MIAMLAQMPGDIGNFTWVHRVVAFAAALVVVAATIELIRRRKLREEYAMLWIAASAGLLVLGLFPQIIWHVSRALGVYYLTLMVILAFGFLALVVIHFAVVITRMGEDSRQMAQRMAMLQHELERLREGGCESPDPTKAASDTDEGEHG
jgi:hypothetical protein